MVCADGGDSSIGMGSYVRGDFVGFGTRLRIFHASGRIVEWVDAIIVRADNDFRVMGIDALRSPHESLAE